MDDVLDHDGNRNQNEANNGDGPRRRLLQRPSSASSGHFLRLRHRVVSKINELRLNNIASS